MRNDFELTIGNFNPFVQGDGSILVLDDDKAQLTIIQECYDRSNKENELICMYSSEKLIHFLNQVKDGRSKMPEVILLDLNMPKGGFSILTEIRDMDHFKVRPRIIVFTSSESDQDREKAKKLNADGFFSKPIRIKEYINFFNQL